MIFFQTFRNHFNNDYYYWIIILMDIFKTMFSVVNIQFSTIFMSYSVRTLARQRYVVEILEKNMGMWVSNDFFLYFLTFAMWHSDLRRTILHIIFINGLMSSFPYGKNPYEKQVFFSVRIKSISIRRYLMINFFSCFLRLF